MDTKIPVRLELMASASRLRCRPSELYLGAATVQQRLHIYVCWDSNVYEDDIVAEWLEEVKIAIEFYLSDPSVI